MFGGIIPARIAIGQAAVAEDVTEERHASMQQLIQAVSCTVPVIKNGHVERLTDLAIDVQAVCRGVEATIEKLVDREAKFSELDLNI